MVKIELSRINQFLLLKLNEEGNVIENKLFIEICKLLRDGISEFSLLNIIRYLCNNCNDKDILDKLKELIKDVDEEIIKKLEATFKSVQSKGEKL